jgi:hypothetical protein
MRSFELVGLDILAEIKHEKKGETEDIIPYLFRTQYTDKQVVNTTHLSTTTQVDKR